MAHPLITPAQVQTAVEYLTNPDNLGKPYITFEGQVLVQLSRNNCVYLHAWVDGKWVESWSCRGLPSFQRAWGG